MLGRIFKKQLQESPAVAIAEEHILAAITPLRQMMGNSGHHNSCHSRHKVMASARWSNRVASFSAGVGGQSATLKPKESLSLPPMGDTGDLDKVSIYLGRDGAPEREVFTVKWR